MFVIANPDRVRVDSQSATHLSTRSLCQGSEQPSGGVASLGRGECRICGGSYRLKLDDTLVKHRATAA